MTRSIYEIEKEVRNLGRPEQERLLRALLEELDGPADYDVESTWLEEVKRRSAEFDAGFVRAIPADEVFDRALARFKR